LVAWEVVMAAEAVGVHSEEAAAVMEEEEAETAERRAAVVTAGAGAEKV
jgi:hypothetical protein